MEQPKWHVKPPAPGSRCAKCNSAEVSSLPTFALGCGVAYRAIADDVFCRRCGHCGQPAYDSVKSSPQS